MWIAEFYAGKVQCTSGLSATLSAEELGIPSRNCQLGSFLGWTAVWLEWAPDAAAVAEDRSSRGFIGTA